MVRLEDPIQMELSTLQMVPCQANQTVPCSDGDRDGETYLRAQEWAL